jgi:hypothetical protein
VDLKIYDPNMVDSQSILTFQHSFEEWHTQFKVNVSLSCETPAKQLKYLANHISPEVKEYLSPFMDATFAGKAPADKYTFLIEKLKNKFKAEYKLYDEFHEMDISEWGEPSELEHQLENMLKHWTVFQGIFREVEDPKKHPMFLQLLLARMPKYITDKLHGMSDLTYEHFLARVRICEKDPTLVSKSTKKPKSKIRSFAIVPTPTISSSTIEPAATPKQPNQGSKQYRPQRLNYTEKRAQQGTPAQPKTQESAPSPPPTTPYKPRPQTKEVTESKSAAMMAKSASWVGEHIFIKISLKGLNDSHVVPALLDTGAGASFMSADLAKTLGITLEPASAKLVTMSNALCKIEKQGKVHTTIDNKSLDIQYLIAGDLPCPLVLGLPDCFKFQISYVATPKGWQIQLDGKNLEIHSESQTASFLGYVTPADEFEPETIPESELNNIPNVSEHHLFDPDVNPEISPALKSSVHQLLSDFSDVFHSPQSKFWQAPITEHTIPTSTDVPPRMANRRFSPKKQAILDAQFEEWKENGIIEPCQIGGYNNQPVIVPKGNDKFRVCFDYRALNKITIRAPYPSKYLRDVIDQFKGVKWISKIDLTSSYLQIPIAPADRHKTAFMTPDGLYQMVGMAFGLKGAGDTMQRVMNQILDPVKDFVTNYVDDTWVITRTDDLNQHLRQLKSVLEIFRKYKLYINHDKCKFAYREIDALGHIVSQGVTRLPDVKVRAFLELRPPRNQAELMKVIGVFGFYRRFIPHYAEIILPLTELLKTKADWKWTDVEQQAFDKLKSLMTSDPILVLPDLDKPFLVRTDASGFATGAALLQEHNDMLMPVAYFSKKLLPAERNYTTTEREMLAVIQALKEWELFLEGSTFSVETDHSALRYLLDLKDPPTSRMARWVVYLQQFVPFSILHRPGKEMQLPDALSRNVLFAAGKVQKEQSKDTLAEDQQSDILWSAIIRAIESGTPPSSPEANSIFTLHRDSLEIHNGRLVYLQTLPGRRGKGEILTRPVIPASRRKLVIEEFHSAAQSGHLGFEKTYKKIRLKFWWPNMWNDVEQYCKLCVTCSKVKSANQRYTGDPKASNVGYPNQRVATDFIGPLPETTSGMRYILTFVDCFTGWPEAVATPDCTADTFVKHFIDIYICRQDPPKEILSDNGSAFIAEVTKLMTERARVQQLFTPVYHPQANPSERLNQTLQSSLRALVEQHTADWDYFIPFALRGIRVAPNARTGFSPYYLHHGRHPVSALEVEWNLTDAPESIEDFANRLAKEVPTTQLEALLNHEKSRQKEDRAIKAKSVVSKFSVGDFVLVEKKYFAAGISPKLAPKYEGPYRIAAKHSASEFVISFPDGDAVIHVKRLKKFDGTPPQIEQENRPVNPDEIEVEPDATLTPESLVGQRISVFWKTYKQWYRGTVVAHVGKLHEVKYDSDGDTYASKLFGANKLKWKQLLVIPGRNDILKSGSVTEVPSTNEPPRSD